MQVEQDEMPPVEHVARLGARPVDVTLEDGQQITLAAHPVTNDNRFRVVVTSKRPIRIKRRRRARPPRQP